MRRQSSTACPHHASTLCRQWTRGGTCARLPRQHTGQDWIDSGTSVSSRLLSCSELNSIMIEDGLTARICGQCGREIYYTALLKIDGMVRLQQHPKHQKYGSEFFLSVYSSILRITTPLKKSYYEKTRSNFELHI